MSVSLSARTLVPALFFAFALAAGGASAGAQPLERVQTDPTSWWWFYGQTPQSLGTIVQRDNARIVDIAAEPGGGPLRFSAALVSNTGAYAKRWWWWYGQSADDLNAKLGQLNARLISISPYQDAGQLKFAAVMVANDGADAKQWWWFYGSGDYVARRIGSLGARVVDLERYTYNGAAGYAAIAIANSGSDAAAWWWYFNVPPQNIPAAADGNAQALTFAPDGPHGATADFTLQGCPCGSWWWYYGQSATGVSDLAAQNGARLTSVRPYDDGNGNRLFDVVMVNNSNALETRIGGIMRGKGHGWSGFYLKEVGGPVLGRLNENRPFDPASAIKIVIATYAMAQVQNGAASLDDQVPLLDRNNYCAFQQSGTESLRNAITQMMQNSDNARTDALARKYGLANLTSFAHALGMQSTQFVTYINCSGPHNHLTLADAAKLYEGIANGTILNGASAGTLFSMMAGKDYDFSGTWAGLQAIAAQEAPPGLTPAQLASFENAVRLSYKAGNYGYPGIPDIEGNPENMDIGLDGLVQLPYCNGSAQAARRYVFGFFYEETPPGAPRDAVWNGVSAGAEILREQIRGALSGWARCA